MNNKKIAGMNITYRFLPFETFLTDMQKLGISNVEIWGGAPHFYYEDVTSKDVLALKKDLKSRYIKLVCFTPEQCMYPINIASSNKSERVRSLDFFKKNIKLTSELECNLMLITPGWEYYNTKIDASWQRSKEALNELANFAATKGVRLGLEILRKDESNLVNNYKTLMAMEQEVGNENLGIILDTIPMAINGETPKIYVEHFNNKLFHVHFIDGNPFNHLAWGDGILDSNLYLKQLCEGGYNGFLTLEITDKRYMLNPYAAIKQSIETLK